MTHKRVGLNALLRPAGMLLSVGCVVQALRHFEVDRVPTALEWGWLGAALGLSILWQWGLRTPSAPFDELRVTGRSPLKSGRGSAHAEPVEARGGVFQRPVTPERSRRIIGTIIVLGGAGLWIWAVRALYLNWADNFDRTWVAWLSAAAALSIGLDLLWGRWPQPAAATRLRNVYVPLLILTAVAAAYRLGNITDFPGEGAQTQIEDVMTGLWGQIYVNGSRGRWEYLSWSWLAGLGIWLGGPTLTAMRIPFAAVSALKTIPIFLWLRLAVGPIGALAGTALFVSSTWDIVLSRIPNNHNGLIVATAFALLAGPARRGRPSAYVWLGFLSGYVLHEYVAYRPLAFFALFGATAISLRDANSRWLARLARPTITLALLGTMVVPLFCSRLHDRIGQEYFDGFNRARESPGYYEPHGTWEAFFSKRLQRASNAMGLFFFNGDSSPVRNMNLRPLVDQVAGTLLLFGIAYAITHPFCGVIGLTLVGFAATVAGTLIVTGNFDVARVGGAVPYTYALVGFGAAAVVAALTAAWGRIGRMIAIALLAGGVIAATYLNTTFVYRFWTSLNVRQAMRNNLPYLCTWLREHQKANEQVVGVAPMYTYVIGPSDAAWLRGREMPGLVVGDIESALRYWVRTSRPSLLFVFEGPYTRDVKTYLEQLIPGLQFELDVDRIEAGGDVVYAHVAAPPPGLAERLDSIRCRGAHTEFDLIGAAPTEVLMHVTSVAPFLDAAGWPSILREAIDHLEGKARMIRATVHAAFTVQTPGAYTFELEAFPGSAQLRIDGQQHAAPGNPPLPLAAGTHTVDISGQLNPSSAEDSLRLTWNGPDSHGRRELVPFYRIAIPDPTCNENTR